MLNAPDLQVTIERFESFVRHDPANPSLWMDLGDLYHRAGRFDEAFACFEKTLTIVPEHTPARSRMASVLISRHHFQEAEHLLRQLLHEGEQTPALQHNLGLSLFFQRRWKEAQDCFELARANGLHLPANLRYLAMALHHQGEIEQAIVACQDWVRISNSPDGTGMLAVLEMDNGNMATACLLASQALAQDPGNTDAAVVLGTAALNNQEIAEALQHFDHVVRSEPDNGRGWLGLGLAQLYEQHHEQAIAALGTAQKLMPTNAGTIVALGWAQLSHQDVQGAEKTFRDALEADRNFGESHGGLAVALAMQGRLAESREEIKIASRLDPQGFGATYARALLLHLDNNPKTATKMIARVLEQPPQPGAKPLMEYLRIAHAKRTSDNTTGK